MQEWIETRQQGTLFEIVLNRPEKRNAMHWPMLQALEAALDTAEKTAGLRAVVLRGAGSGFSAGIDVNTFAELPALFGDHWPQNMLNITRAFQRVFSRFEQSPLPVIVLLHGYVLGLGLELALACDFRYAAPGTRLGLPEARLGIIPDVGGTTRLTRLLGPARAKELILTGRTIEAEQAAAWGLVNGLEAPEKLVDRAQALAAEIALCAPLAVSYGKRVIEGGADLERGLQFEAWAQNMLIQSEDFGVGVQAFLTKTPPEWRGR